MRTRTVKIWQGTAARPIQSTFEKHRLDVPVHLCIYICKNLPNLLIKTWDRLSFQIIPFPRYSDVIF